MSAKDGGPAFPTGFDPLNVAPDVGMTLRDYFAAKAMQAVITATLGSQAVAQALQKLARESGECEAAFTARTAYDYADNMLAERAKCQNA